jgi:hypothetical protein
MSTTIKLQYPVLSNAVEYEELTIRRPKVKDRRLAMKQGKDDADKEIWLIATLTGVSMDVIDELDSADYSKIQAVLQDFLSGETTP